MNEWKNEWNRTENCVSNSDKLEHRQGKCKKVKEIIWNENLINKKNGDKQYFSLQKFFWCKQTANLELKFNEIKLNLIFNLNYEFGEKKKLIQMKII